MTFRDYAIVFGLFLAVIVGTEISNHRLLERSVESRIDRLMFDEVHPPLREQQSRIDAIERWADEAIGLWPWTDDLKVKQEEKAIARRSHLEEMREKATKSLLQLEDGVERQKKIRAIYGYLDGWVYHEVRPLEGEPWVEFTEGQPEPDPAKRTYPPKLGQYVKEHPGGDLLHGWKDETIDGGVLWTEFGSEIESPPKPTPTKTAGTDAATYSVFYFSKPGYKTCEDLNALVLKMRPEVKAHWFRLSSHDENQRTAFAKYEVRDVPVVIAVDQDGKELKRLIPWCVEDGRRVLSVDVGQLEEFDGSVQEAN